MLRGPASLTYVARVCLCRKTRILCPGTGLGTHVTLIEARIRSHQLRGPWLGRSCHAQDEGRTFQQKLHGEEETAK